MDVRYSSCGWCQSYKSYTNPDIRSARLYIVNFSLEAASLLLQKCSCDTRKVRVKVYCLKKLKNTLCPKVPVTSKLTLFSVNRGCIIKSFDLLIAKWFRFNLVYDTWWLLWNMTWYGGLHFWLILKPYFFCSMRFPRNPLCNPSSQHLMEWTHPSRLLKFWEMTLRACFHIRNWVGNGIAWMTLIIHADFSQIIS